MGEQLRQIDALEAAQQAREADESQLELKADGLRALLLSRWRNWARRRWSWAA